MTIQVKAIQNSPIWEVDEKTAPSKSAIKGETTAAFDEKEDLFFKKLNLRADNCFFGPPKLTHPDFCDSKIDQAVFDAFNEQRINYNVTTHLNYEEVRHKQHHQKVLHQEKDRLMKEIEEQAQISTNLGWGQVGAAIGFVAFSVFAVAATILTGGVGAVALGAMGAVLGAAQGTLGGVNGLHDLKTKEIEGLVQENQMIHDHHFNGTKGILDDSQMTMKQMSQHNANQATIQKNRSLIRMF